MAKALAVQLQEALAKGDVAKAKSLADRLAAAAPARKRAKVAKPEPPPQEPAAEAAWIAPSRKAGPRTKVGRDGQVHVESRRVSMAGGETRENTFVDRGRGGMDPSVAAVAKKVKAAAGRPEPRDAAVKVDVDCDGCGKAFSVYPSELTKSYDDDGRSFDLVYKCVRCIRRGR